jgi:hypothetical protein
VGSPWGFAAGLAEKLVLDVREGRAISRRDTVGLERAVLEGEAVRAAEAVLEAEDGVLAARVVELAGAILGEGVEQHRSREGEKQ